MPAIVAAAEPVLILGLCLLGILSLHLALLTLARISLPRRDWSATLPADDELPHVLVQIPLYNEGDLIEPLLHAITHLDWPQERLRIQVLDDSTDGSLAVSAKAVKELAADGWTIELRHRQRRTGYKAGALANGLDASDAPLIAIFDADFLPPPEFLRRTVGVLLAHPELSHVQARWLHANRSVSLLTRAQARLLDGHFRVEQEARQRMGLPVPFNGTCGIWRRSAIEDAGGWQGDTLTEDLDLSLRARLNGWSSAYLGDLGVPGALPTSPRAWRQQQFRWTKGFAECLIKLLPQIWLSHRLPVWQKLMVTLQLSQPTVFLVGCVSILAGLPFIAGAAVPGPVLSTIALIMACGGLLGPISMLAVGARGTGTPFEIGREIAAALLFSSGLMLSNARAVLEALAGHRSAFVRTPKHSHPSPGAAGAFCLCGAAEVTTGAALLAFTLSEQPLAVFPLALAISGLLSFGLLQATEVR
jgi:cellulose synthase/poly-beta-1,6-N-acetylglucosamine synthase-like glycosyltransferase